jgi:hypothetical protein
MGLFGVEVCGPDPCGPGEGALAVVITVMNIRVPLTAAIFCSFFIFHFFDELSGCRLNTVYVGVTYL